MLVSEIQCIIEFAQKLYYGTDNRPLIEVKFDLQYNLPIVDIQETIFKVSTFGRFSTLL